MVYHVSHRVVKVTVTLLLQLPLSQHLADELWKRIAVYPLVHAEGLERDPLVLQKPPPEAVRRTAGAHLVSLNRLRYRYHSEPSVLYS